MDWGFITPGVAGGYSREALRAFLGWERSHFRIAQHIFPLAIYGEGVADRPRVRSLFTTGDGAGLLAANP